MIFMAASALSGGSGNVKGTSRIRSTREDKAKVTVAEQISQAVQSTSNLLNLKQQTSASQAQLMKLPKNLLAKASAIKNTGQALEQMPQVISSLDAHMEYGLERFEAHLRTVIQLLANMENSQLNFPSHAHLSQEEKELSDHPPEVN